MLVCDELRGSLWRTYQVADLKRRGQVTAHKFRSSMSSEWLSRGVIAPRVFDDSNGKSLLPRLLTVEQAARYLGFASTAALKNLPVKPIHLVEVGPGSSPKYDRHALDRWLDALSGVEVRPEPACAPVPDDADDALRAWELRRVAAKN